MAGWWFLFWIMILNSERAMCQPDLSSLVEKSRWRNLRNTSLMLMVCDGGQRSGCGSLPTCPLNLYQAASPPPKVAVLVSTFDFNFKLDFNRNLIFVDSNFCPRNTFFWQPNLSTPFLTRINSKSKTFSFCGFHRIRILLPMSGLCNEILGCPSCYFWPPHVYPRPHKTPPLRHSKNTKLSAPFKHPTLPTWRRQNWARRPT